MMKVNPNSHREFVVERGNESERMYTFRFTVSGRGYFPFDMLRRERCWPADTDSAVNIHWSTLSATDADRFDKRDVVLIALHPSRSWRPTYMRWQSFGWSVVENVAVGRDGADWMDPANVAKLRSSERVQSTHGAKTKGEK